MKNNNVLELMNATSNTVLPPQYSGTEQKKMARLKREYAKMTDKELKALSVIRHKTYDKPSKEAMVAQRELYYRASMSLSQHRTADEVNLNRYRCKELNYLYMD